MSWSFGPLHAGEGSTDCLTDAKPGLAVGGAVGLAIGSLILGALLMLGIFHFFGGGSPRFRDRDTEGAPLRPYRGGESSLAPTPYLEQEGESSRSLMDGSPEYSGGLGLGYQSGTLGKKYTTASTSSYRIEPFDPNSVQLQREPTTSPRESRVGNDGSRSSQVYVVHHDGGPPPVSIYTGDGTQVVELRRSFCLHINIVLTSALFCSARLSWWRRRQRTAFHLVLGLYGSSSNSFKDSAESTARGGDARVHRTVWCRSPSQCGWRVGKERFQASVFAEKP